MLSRKINTSDANSVLIWLFTFILQHYSLWFT